MPDLFANATFPGINQIHRFSMTLSRGVTPSPAVLSIVPQQNLQSITGDLILSFGGNSFVFPDCRVDQNSFERNNNGEIWQLTIFDRRWKWAFGALHGYYNLRQDDAEGTILPGTEKTPRELVSLCLDSLNETEYDVSAVPNDSRPAVEWEVTPPAKALANLCETLGCDVVIGSDNKVVVVPLNEGAQIPINGYPVIENSFSLDIPETPSRIVAYAARNRYEADLELEAIGLEEDGEVKLIDDLSYRPANGWEQSDPPHFYSIEDEKIRDLARKWIFRGYRVKMPAKIPFVNLADDEGPRLVDVERLEQITPFFTEQIGSWDYDQGRWSSKQNVQPIIYGVHSQETEGYENSEDPDPNTPMQTLVRVDFTLDERKAIVRFGQAVRRWIPSGSGGGLWIAPAILRLRISMPFRQNESMAYYRHWVIRDLGDFGTPDKSIKSEEVRAELVPRYTEDYELDGVEENYQDVERHLNYLIDQALKEYDLKQPQTVAYAGLFPIQLDGAIQTVGWDFGTTTEARTTVTRNFDPPRRCLSYRERRNLLQAAAEKEKNGSRYGRAVK